MEINPGRPVPPPGDNDRVSFVPMAAVEAGTGRMDGSKSRPWSEVKKGYTVFREEDVLFAKITPCMENGKCAVAEGLVGGIGAGSTEFHVLRASNALNASYLRFFLSQEFFRNEARAHMSGAVGQLRVPSDFVFQHLIPIPPLAEQRRIVAEIERNFSRLDAAVAALERVSRQLNAYRRSVLNGAVGGAHFETGADGLPRLRDVPLDWRVLPLSGLLVAPLINGRSVTDREGGFPVLRLTALRGGRVLLKERKLGAWSAEEAAPFLVRRGDFFVARGNGSIEMVGRGGLLDQEPDPVAFPDTFIRVRIDSTQILPDYFRLVWDSSLVRRQIEKTARTTAGIYKINQSILEAYLLVVPSIRDQGHIVEYTDRKLTIALQIERAVTINRRRAERLRQSILKRAFEGRLVPQDTADEPASILLERIRREGNDNKDSTRSIRKPLSSNGTARRRITADEPPYDIPTYSSRRAVAESPAEYQQASFTEENR